MLNFFEDNKLVLTANNHANISIWTDLGQPVFTTGTWNIENYTNTLMLDAFSEAVISWETYSIITYADLKSGVFLQMLLFLMEEIRHSTLVQVWDMILMLLLMENR